MAEKEFNPMLACEGVLGNIDYPTLALPKHNGVRGLNRSATLLARSLKSIPNLYTRRLFSDKELEDLEGELVVGDPFDEEVFANSTSGVMTQAGYPEVTWYLFDSYHASLPYSVRLEILAQRIDEFDDPRLQVIPHHLIYSDEELVNLTDKYLKQGFEGMVLRKPTSTYKHGRSTAKEQGFMRFCPWHRSECTILEIIEGAVNMNESKKNELGFLKKSSHKENLVPSGRAGSVRVKDVVTGITFNITIGPVKLQDDMWQNKDKYLGTIWKYKFKPPVIIGGKPRFPQLEGPRHALDM